MPDHNQNAIAVIHDVAVTGADGGVPAQAQGGLPVVAQWQTIRHLPGYMQDSIRDLGYTIFRQFPCFAVHEAATRAKGADPVGEVKIVAAITDAGGGQAREVDAVAAWVRANGVVLEANELEFPQHFPGYRPRVILAVTETETFLLVDETRERGAPVDARYVYQWTGGRRYHENRLGNRAEAGAAVAPPAPRIAAVPNAQPAAPTPEAAPPVQARRKPARPVRAPRVKREDVPAVDVETRVARSPAVAALRAAGFLPCGTARGPGLRKSAEDERSVVVFGEPGKPLSMSATLTYQVIDRDGTVLEENLLTDPLDAIESLQPPTSSPRM